MYPDLMKKLLLSLCLVCGIVSIGSAQELNYGFKAGGNYTMTGEIEEYDSTLRDGDSFQAKGQIGFHGGAFLQVNFGNIFVRPEVVYSSLKSKFDFPTATSTYSVETFTIPLLVGYNVFRLFDIYAGPVYSKILNASISGNENVYPMFVQNKESSVNGQIGIKAAFARFEIDIRYEHSLSTSEMQSIDFDNSKYGINRSVFWDSRINQVIVGIIYNIGKHRF